MSWNGTLVQTAAGLAPPCCVWICFHGVEACRSMGFPAFFYSAGSVSCCSLTEQLHWLGRRKLEKEVGELGGTCRGRTTLTALALNKYRMWYLTSPVAPSILGGVTALLLCVKRTQNGAQILIRFKHGSACFWQKRDSTGEKHQLLRCRRSP